MRPSPFSGNGAYFESLSNRLRPAAFDAWAVPLRAYAICSGGHRAAQCAAHSAMDWRSRHSVTAGLQRQATQNWRTGSLWRRGGTSRPRCSASASSGPWGRLHRASENGRRREQTRGFVEWATARSSEWPRRAQL